MFDKNRSSSDLPRDIYAPGAHGYCAGLKVSLVNLRLYMEFYKLVPSSRLQAPGSALDKNALGRTLVFKVEILKPEADCER